MQNRVSLLRDVRRPLSRFTVVSHLQVELADMRKACGQNLQGLTPRVRSIYRIRAYLPQSSGLALSRI
jgi:hypothetical protein